MAKVIDAGSALCGCVLIMLLCATPGILAKEPGYYDYDLVTHTVPGFFHNYRTKVYTNIAILSLEMDSAKETLSVAAQFALAWQTNIVGIVGNIPPSEMWTPDIIIFNGVEDMRPAAWRRDYLVTMDGSGDATWIFGGNMKVSCDADLHKFPWDTQECEIILMSNSAHSSQMEFVKGDFGMIDLYYSPNGEWEKTSQEIEYGSLTHSEKFDFPKFTLKFTLQRKSTYYVAYIIIPCFVLSSLTIFVFLLPSDAGEKVGLGITIQLSFVVFIFLMAEQIPSTAQVVPQIMVYLLCMMIHSTLATMAAVSVLMLHHHNTTDEPGCCVKNFIVEFLGRLLCIGCCNNKVDNKGQGDDDKKKKYEKAAIILDRLYFWFFLITAVLITIICLYTGY